MSKKINKYRSVFGNKGCVRELPLLVVVYLCSKRAFYIHFILIENVNWPWKRLFYAKVFPFTRLRLDAIVIATDTKAQNHHWAVWYPSDCHDLCSNFPAVEAIVAIATIIWKPESIVCVLAIWSYERKLLQIRLITQCAFSNMILVDKTLYPLWLSTTVSLMLHVRGVFLFFIVTRVCCLHFFNNLSNA